MSNDPMLAIYYLLTMWGKGTKPSKSKWPTHIDAMGTDISWQSWFRHVKPICNCQYWDKMMWVMDFDNNRKYWSK